MSRIDLDIEALTAAGLYDAGSPESAERLELIEFLVEQGCTLDEMTAANERGRLFALAGDRIVRPGRDMFTLAEVAEQIGCPVDEVQAVWRAFGLVLGNPDQPVAGV